MTEARVPVTDDALVEKVAREIEPKSWAAIGTGDSLAHQNRRTSSLRKAAKVIAIAYHAGVAAGREEAAKIADRIADESVLVLDEHDARIRHEGIVAGARASATYIRQIGQK